MVIFHLFEYVMTPNQFRGFVYKWQLHEIGEKINASCGLYVDPDDAKISSGLPKGSQCLFRSKITSRRRELRELRT